ncbi:MAG: cupin domain-containing protein [Thermoplasmata archaeon]
MKYTRLFEDEEGESHFEDVQVEFELTEFAPPAPPLGLSHLTEAKRFGFLSVPPGWHGDWHPTPKRQVVFCLAGEMVGEASDGEARRFGPGSAVLLEDTTGIGHRSRAAGEREVLLAVVQLEE